MTRQAPRYRVTSDGHTVTLTSSDPTVCAALGVYDSETVERTYWVPGCYPVGYVREVTPTRPGTLGHQVCERLQHGGNTLVSSPEALLRVIRAELRAAIRAYNRFQHY